MARAPKKCLTAGCRKPATKKGKCDDCYEPWIQTSPRNLTRPKNAATLIRRVRRRDRDRCYLCGAYGPLVDHVNPVAEGGDWSMENMACICDGCHTEKSQAEAVRGKARRA
jgi:5-methylcytosine-specific restriction protein A